MGNFSQIKGRGDEKKILKSSENDQLTGHFQNVFFPELFFLNYLLISPETVKKCVLILQIFYHSPQKLDRTIIFNSVTLKNTQTEPQKYIIIFNETNNI